MNAPAAVMVSLGQCLSTMSLYSSGHPARERVLDSSFAKLADLLNDIQYADFSIIGDGVVFHDRVVEELRNWDWAPRLSAAGIGRIEIDADVTREDWSLALDEMYARLDGKPMDSSAQRQTVATSVRFGPLRVLAGAEGAEQAVEEKPAPAIEYEAAARLALSLAEEVVTVNWIHEEVLSTERIPMAEVEAVVGSLAIAMHRDKGLLLPLVMLKEFDQYTTTHACNVAVLAMGLAEAVGCSRAEVRAFGVAGLLHDIGKVRVPRDILNKPGRLTPEEMSVMATHPAEGARILLEKHKQMQMAAVVAYEHHVHLDGAGYPRFQWNRGCHFASRLVHVCDIYDALSTNRPYRKPWTTEQVLNYIEERARSELDPSLAHTFASMVRGATIAPMPPPGLAG
ncbi:MAG: HD domain-containing protein [Gemmatimonadaceae bacterium]|nr:HD domain-containing protein [Gemmatimonadaceae bacterium]